MGLVEEKLYYEVVFLHIPFNWEVERVSGAHKGFKNGCKK
jgi:hypothetical protein